MSRLAAARKRLFLLILFVGCVCIVCPHVTVTAQENNLVFLKPKVLTSQYAFLFDSTMIADRAGNLHVFWVGWCGDEIRSIERKSEPTDEPLDICYLRKDRSTEWFPVVNILRVPRMIPPPAATVDKYGIIHLIWREDACLWYSWSANDVALYPWSWLEHQRCLVQAGPTYQSIAYDDPDNTLYVLYVSPQGEVRLIRSHDNGMTWSGPYLVAEPRGATDADKVVAFAGYPNLALGADGTLHAAWSTYPRSGYPSQGLFYTRSTDGGRTWQAPIEIGGAHHSQARLLAYSRSNLIVIWNGDIGISGRYSRWSTDNGMTWSELNIVLPQNIAGGMVGPPAAVVDQTNVVHVLLPTDGWIYYTKFHNGKWSAAIPLSTPEIYPDGTSIVGFVPDQEETRTPDLVITEGNQLHATWTARDTYLLCYVAWEVDGVRKPPGEFVLHRDTNSLAQQPVISSSLDDSVEIAASPQATKPPPSERYIQRSDHLITPTGLWRPVIMGILPVLVLVAIMGFIKALRIRGGR